MDESLEISWYGRCCFLVEINGKKILFDPYDQYCSVDIGLINANLLLSSSTWHDHGHIGASPHAWIFTYPGVEENSGFIITGIESKENRGTPNVVFNISYKGISITNFADLGSEGDEEFDKSLTVNQRAVLRSTNIAFMRPSIVDEEISYNNVHNEKVLKYCQPNIIFPEHYFPESFIDEQVPNSEKAKFNKPNIITNELPEAIGYPVKEIDDYKVTISSKDFQNIRSIYKLLRLHPQVQYINP
ncbi:hypothetical protein A2Z22_02375 [Candidatus Woesebacteria bacterium RBG_16_34_12]|uniref:Metallo-beta-lactamase domain-containing protein n=1 Tax=Candidatus Woesebacteria bacterium RBG_16_34_12 TaxID=1802480 RepID=A0A1F7X9B3_9BACT|nr:MAG: hypothetical protein A2Z22_02375 [Candidatus Woesebacteria bacterium RBG_16_34_12]